MDAISEIVAQTGDSVYKLKNAVTTLRAIIECNIMNKEDCFYALPLFEIVQYECSKLQDNFNKLENQIYGKMFFSSQDNNVD